ncbi:hypothetical protein GM921_00190 [Pedobacter sp. LMG 31464]|uniref:Lipocalin-like domain-containing protein n=1 Tax=Pedobacter planticolens TaxID=2679964 RepID=A0A923DW47_9SPHI|nr:hypothetical protein [Pedobacter planticolens]MBB2143888.1 hypothetical protein [Pedobacter planticolens]
MKKRLVLAGTILLFIAGFSACKKQDEATKPLRAKMVGKWQVNKIDVTTAGSATITTTYAATDYLDFKDNESDDFELGLGSNRSVGTFGARVGDEFYMDFSSKDLDCTVSAITTNKFQFTGTVVGSNPKVTETYYLSR